MLIDSHHHFWDPSKGDYTWMNGKFSPLRRPYGPRELEPELTGAGVGHTVLVQARADVDETVDLLAIAAEHDFVVGVIGWVDLTSRTVSKSIRAFRGMPGGDKLVGFRHLLHDEDDPQWLLHPGVQRNIRRVGEAGLAFDFLVRVRELPGATETARRHSGMRFVIDHLAKPQIDGDAPSHNWRHAISRIGELSNVYCKISGLVTEVDLQRWSQVALDPYVKVAVDSFGPHRLLVGSDWPVCLLAGAYGVVIDAYLNALRSVGGASATSCLHANTIRAYGLRID